MKAIIYLFTDEAEFIPWTLGFQKGSVVHLMDKLLLKDVSSS